MKIHRYSSFTQTILFVTGLFLISESMCFAQSEDSNGWNTMTESTGEPSYRHENAFTLIDEKMYLLGGRGERPVDIYDPESDTWTEGATPPVNMHHLQAASFDGKIYIIGAFTGNFPGEDPIPYIYIYDPSTDQWEQGPEIPENRRRGAAGSVVHNGKIYIVGGSQNGHIDGHVLWFDSFDPVTGEWEILPNIPRHRDHFHAAVVNNKLYAVGGRRTSQATGRTFELTIPEIDVYDFESGTWDVLPPSGDLPTERAGTTAIGVDNYLLVLGGESASQTPAHSEVEIYNTTTGEWSTLPELNTGRHGFQVILYDGNLYVAAGSQTRGADEINTLEYLSLPDSVLGQ